MSCHGRLNGLMEVRGLVVMKVLVFPNPYVYWYAQSLSRDARTTFYLRECREWWQMGELSAHRLVAADCAKAFMDMFLLLLLDR